LPDHRRVITSPRTLLVALALAFAGCTRTPEIASVGGIAQGTTYTLQWWSEPRVDSEAVGAAAAAELERIDELLSNYRPDSALEKFNATRSIEPQVLPAELVALLRLAVEVHVASDRCFDPTVRPLVRVWGFDGDKPRVPQPTAIETALADVGLEKLEILDAQRVRKTTPRVEVDMASIGQGYTVGRLAKVVESLGITNYIVEIGGELQARGRKPGGEHWRIGIENPTAAGGVAEPLVVPGDQQVAVITSGTYRHHFEDQGRSYGHILDPRTGRPVEHDLVETTVIGSDPTRAAAWATALLCLGPDAGARTADREKLAATLAVQAGDAVIRTHSAQFDADWGSR
jgi:thiamine biosynthesis lipoprotein